MVLQLGISSAILQDTLASTYSADIGFSASVDFDDLSLDDVFVNKEVSSVQIVDEDIVFVVELLPNEANGEQINSVLLYKDSQPIKKDLFTTFTKTSSMNKIFYLRIKLTTT